jgi:drug/metabolite transporter (DMT)-like permease
MPDTATVVAPDPAITGAPHVQPGEQRLAVAAALITVVFWASAFVGIRAAGRILSPGSLSLARLVVGSVALGVLALARGHHLPSRRDLGGVIMCGLLWFGAYNVLLNQAERLVDAGTAAMLVNIGPVFIALLSGLLLREGFPPRLLLGCAIAFAGTVTIGLATSTHGLQAGTGAVLCIAAAAAYAGGVTAEKPLLARNSALTITWLACTVGTIACLPFAPQLVHDAARADLGTIAWTIYLGLVPTAVGFSLWAYALARTSAGRLGATTYLVPPVAIVMGWLLLGDVPPGLALGGGFICLAGVAVTRGVRLPRRRERQVAAAP